jgi:hypothetical protein
MSCLGRSGAHICPFDDLLDDLVLDRFLALPLRLALLGDLDPCCLPR